jgi:cytochrome P450
MSQAEVGTYRETVGTSSWDFFQHLHDAGGILWDENFKAWLVGSYELVKKVGLGDDDVFEGPFILVDDRPMPFGLTYQQWVDFWAWGSHRMISAIPGDETHAHQHRWWMRTFSPRRLEGWRDEVIRPVSHELIDRFAGRGRAELGADFADGLAPRVMAGVMGLPHDDDAWLAKLAELHGARMALKQFFGQDDVEQSVIDTAFEATAQANELLAPFIDDRRSGKGDDFISLLWRDADELFGPGWVDSDIYGATMAMWEGGAGSTPPSTSNALYLLLCDPDLQQTLRDGDPALIKNFVEESLRMYGPVYHRPRLATRDVELGGQTVRKGDTVLMLTVAGSRDDARYACPHAVDLERPAPRDHFAFLVGTRTCPGQGLVRAELQEAMAVVLERLPNLRLDPDAEPPRQAGLMARRWGPLHVLFDA